MLFCADALSVTELFADCRCPDELSSGRHAFRHNGDDASFCALPNAGADVRGCSPVPADSTSSCHAAASKLPEGLQLVDDVFPQLGLLDDFGRGDHAVKANCMELEADVELCDDGLLGDLCPPDSFLLDDPDAAMECGERHEQSSRAQLVRFNVLRGDMRGFQQ